MSDIAAELAKLHILKGADYSRQVERIARMGVFHPVEGEPSIYSVGGEGGDDYGNLLNAARKAVAHHRTEQSCFDPFNGQLQGQSVGA